MSARPQPVEIEKSVAITGISCRFAGCPTPGAFWDVIRSRKSMLASPGAEAELPLGERNVFDRVYPAKIGGLGNLYSCVPSMHNFPRQVNAGENQDLYFATQLAFDALADAGMKPHAREGVRGSVRVGYAPPFNSATINWLEHTHFLNQTLDILRRFLPGAPEELIGATKVKLVESLPAPNAASFLLGSGYRFASWIARECSFNGAASIMDAGMVTGAVTLQAAMDDLLSGRADVSLAGTLTPPLNRVYIEGLSGEVMFSRRGEIHPFANDQDGTLPGEGGAFFVLKRRRDALRDHDRIYACVRAIAVGHAPEDQPEAIISEALRMAETKASSIGLVEADGSCIAAAEAREIAAVQRLWGEHRPGAPLVGIGSVKGNIGHTLKAAMSAGVVKAALALNSRVLPPQISAVQPVAALSSIASSAYLLSEERPWIVGDSSAPRRALVLGANFDAVNPVGGAATSGRSAAILLEEEREDRA